MSVARISDTRERPRRLRVADQPIPGANLGTTLDLQGPPPIDLALDLVDQVARGLAEEHGRWRVHGDVRPANVHLYDNGRGLYARLSAGARGAGTSLDAWHFAAPELRAGHAPSAASDVYALGCLLWVVLSGRSPHEGGTILGPRDSLLVGDSLQAASVNHVLACALADDPARRYPSAGAFSDDLRIARGLAGSPGSIAVARPQTVVPVPGIPRRVWAALSLLLAGLAVLGWLMLTGLGS